MIISFENIEVVDKVLTKYIIIQEDSLIELGNNDINKLFSIYDIIEVVINNNINMNEFVIRIELEPKYLFGITQRDFIIPYLYKKIRQ